MNSLPRTVNSKQAAAVSSEPWWKSEIGSIEQWELSDVSKRTSILSLIMNDLLVIMKSPCCWVPLPKFVHHFIHRNKIAEQKAALQQEAVQQQQSVTADMEGRAHANYSSDIDQRAQQVNIDRQLASARDDAALMLTDQQIIECKESFLNFDPDFDGVIRNMDLSNVLQSLGQIKPTDIELSDMISEIESYRSKTPVHTDQQCTVGTKGQIDYHDLLALVARKLKDTAAEEEIRYAFSVFDKDSNGMISTDELRTALLNLGERLDVEEVDEFIAQAKRSQADVDNDGQIMYDDFIKRLMSD